MKKVLFIGNNKYTTIGGQEDYHWRLMNILQDFDCEIDEYVHDLNPYLKQVRSEIPNVKVFKSDFYEKNKIPPKLKILHLNKHFKYSLKYLEKEFLKNKDYDLIIDSTQYIATNILKWNNKFNEKRIWIEHTSCQFFDYSTALGPWFSKFAYWFISTFLNKKAGVTYVKNAVFFTEKDRDDFTKRFNLSLVNSFICTPIFKKNLRTNNLNIKQEKKTKALLYAGRIEQPQKNIKFLCKLSNSLNYPIHLYGQGDLIEYTKKFKNIKYMGSFSEKDEAKIFSSYLYTIVVSNYEGFPFTLIKSIQNGTPIITRDTFSSASYLVNNNKNGFLINKKLSVNQVTQLLNKELDSVNYSKLINNCLSFVQNANFEKQWSQVFAKFNIPLKRSHK